MATKPEGPGVQDLQGRSDPQDAACGPFAPVGLGTPQEPCGFLVVDDDALLRIVAERPAAKVHREICQNTVLVQRIHMPHLGGPAC